MRVRIKFYKEFLLIVTPLIIQQFIAIMLNIVDNIMVGKLGEEAIVAVGISSKLVFVFLLTLFGACSGGGILISQYYGKKDLGSLQKIFFLTSFIAVLFSFVFFAIARFLPYYFTSFFTQEEQIRLLGEEFLQILSYSFPFFAFSIASMVGLRSMGLTKIPLYVTVVATLLNTFLNYCLIYGNFGFVAMGSKGAAIATLVARVVEAICFLAIILNKKHNLVASFKHYTTIPKKMLKTFTKLSTPAFLAEFSWSIGTVVLYAAYAELGTKVTAAITVSEVLFGIGSIIFVGISTGASIVIAQTLGAKKTNKAIWISNEIIKIAVLFAFVTSLICLLAIKPILSFYNLDAETAEMTKKVLFATAAIVFIKMLNWALIVGVLRSGGDTFAAFLIDFIPIVFLAIPVAFLLPKVIDIPIHILMIVVNLEELLKFVISIKRFRTKRWIKNLVN